MLQGDDEHDQWRVFISPDGRWLVTTRGGSTAGLMDLHAEAPAASGVTLLGHESYVSQLKISPDNRWLIAESENRMLRWDLSLDSLMDRADRIAGRELTSQERKKYALE